MSAEENLENGHVCLVPVFTTIGVVVPLKKGGAGVGGAGEGGGKKERKKAEVEDQDDGKKKEKEKTKVTRNKPITGATRPASLLRQLF